MALIVEDGTGRSDAESYISVADATTFLSSRNLGDAWDAAPDQEAALRLATDYMQQRYRGRWKGYRTKDTQALDWPRAEAVKEGSPGGFGGWPTYYSITEIPVEVKRACAMLALKSLSGDLLVDVGRQTASESVGSVSVSYFEGQSGQTKFAAVDALLAPLLGASYGMLAVSRG